MGRIDIIIVNWNSGNQLSDCLSSVYLHGYNLVNRIIIVDNDSADGSAEGIADQFDLPIGVVRNDLNLRVCSGLQPGRPVK